MSTNTHSISTFDGGVLASIRQSIADFLRRCGLKYMDVTIDEAYHSECCQEAINCGFPMDGKYSIHEYMDVGVAMASNAYTHLPDAARMWMCLFTAIATRIDDKVVRGEDMIDVYHFNERFVSCQPQGDPILNALDVILREIASLHSPLVSSLITASTLNFMVANCLDFETEDMQISPKAPLYPEYSRLLSGLVDGYVLFIFPSMLPTTEYIQCMPDLRIVVNHTNDILSYYKEEMQGDNANYLSLMAASRTSTKQDALLELIEKTVQAHHNILECLRPGSEAYDAYVSFFEGYVKFHVALKRYKLKDIMAEISSS
ncbi:isoprenoid synthase domain-containing protein [Suillus fuscotomentosus]|uniref:Isoprenoid synthase domain-containing protein n=1 Tax=Suillus fuscotomentosus TaxID=1912939 RepID=A0AAD4E4S0_9AGAM|nr:isoprenoid synthase domain-containing protein [Suillus fuscotomentosus]KAG1899695.1 isoprenoid synthase domain-containing protein [Suillus fuscotomentosus]